MKAVSLSLKIIAILAAAFSVYAWVDTRGKISSAEKQMQDVEGATLSEKAANVPGLLKSNAELNLKVSTFEKRVATLEKRGDDLNKELETERSKSIKANADVAKKNAEMRTLSASVDDLKKEIKGKDSSIEDLKREIVETKNLLAQTGDIDALKGKIASLESQIEAKNKEIDDAKAKIALMEQGEVMEVIETDAAGNKVVKKVIKVPYVATGDVATVLSVDQANGIVQLNRGIANQVQDGQKINLKREGKFVAEIMVETSADNTAVAMINRGKGIPETIEIGDLLELAPIQVEEPKEESAPVISTPAAAAQDSANAEQGSSFGTAEEDPFGSDF